MSLSGIIIGSFITPFFSLITFFALAVIEELKHVRGAICRCYLAAHIGCMSMSTISGSVLTLSNDLSDHFMSIMIGLGALYFLTATIFWLNVMSLDAWLTSRKLKSSPGIDVIELQDRWIIRSSTYIWGISSMYLLIMIKNFGTVSLIIISVVVLIPVIGMTIFNIRLLILTALMIKQRERETSQRSDKLHKESIQWFKRYVELLVTTTFIFIIGAVGVSSESFLILLPVAVILQSLLTCVIFVRKYEVGRSLCKYFKRQDHPTMTVIQTAETTL